MPRCPRCNSMVEEEDRYCSYCGYPLRAPRKKPQGRELPSWVIAIIIVIAVLGVSIGIYGAVSKSVSPSKTCYYQTVTRYITTTTWVTTYSISQSTIINDKVVVKPVYYLYYTINLDEEATLKGYFRAEGGAGNDIIVVLVDDIGFTNYVNRHAFRSYYYSGKVTTDRFTVTLPPGRYYLVLDNTFSLVSNKVVEINVVKEWPEKQLYPVEVVNTYPEVKYVCS